MSGDVVFLRDQSGELGKLVQAIARLEHEILPRHALIGGLAVIARLQQRHRATADIDEVYQREEVDLVQVLVDRGANEQPNGVILADGAKLDLIAVSEYQTEDLPDDLGPRAFILAHSWALDTALPLSLVVTDDNAAVMAEVTTPVATAASLVAMKLASTLSRRDSAPRKRASDVFDVYRLLTVHDVGGRVSGAILTSPEDLARLTLALADRIFGSEAEKSAR